MDYHIAEAGRLAPSTDFLLTGPKYQASCQCNWRGEERNSMEAADEDAVAHDMAENPIERRS